MNESITRAAGALHGQELAPAAMEALIAALGREPRQRSTLYGPVPAERRAAAFAAPPLEAVQAMSPVKPPPALEAADARLGISPPLASG